MPWVRSRPVEPSASRGAIRLLMAEGLVLPTGLVIAVFLARRLQPEGFGLYALTVAVVITLELVIAFFFSRSTVKLAAESEDPRTVMATALRLRLPTDLGFLVLLWLTAPLLAAALDAPGLMPLIRLAAVDIPISGLARLSRDLLTGEGRFERRAVAAAGRSISRVLLIVGFVLLGLGPAGALLGHICASLIEVVLCGVRLSVVSPTTAPLSVRRFLSYALPLFTYAVGMLLLSRMDLLFLKALVATTATAGLYAVAQNAAHSLGVLTAVVSPVLISLISHRLASGRPEHARQATLSVIRVVLLAAPYIGLVSVTAPQLCTVLFGPRFTASGPILAVLMWAQLGTLFIAVGTAAMTGHGRPAVAARLSLATAATACVLHLIVIPRFGAVGAALVTGAVSWAAALAFSVATRRIAGVAPGARAVFAAATTTITTSGAALVISPGASTVVPVLVALGLVVPILLAAMGALNRRDISEVLAALVPGRTPQVPTGPPGDLPER